MIPLELFDITISFDEMKNERTLRARSISREGKSCLIMQHLYSAPIPTWAAVSYKGSINIPTETTFYLERRATEVEGICREIEWNPACIYISFQRSTHYPFLWRLLSSGMSIAQAARADSAISLARTGHSHRGNSPGIKKGTEGGGGI